MKPHLGPEVASAGELLFYGADARSGGAECVFGVADVSGRVTRTVRVPLERPVLMHDFAVTEHHAVFVEGSLVMDPSVSGAVAYILRTVRVPGRNLHSSLPALQSSM